METGFTLHVATFTGIKLVIDTLKINSIINCHTINYRVQQWVMGFGNDTKIIRYMTESSGSIQARQFPLALKRRQQLARHVAMIHPTRSDQPRQGDAKLVLLKETGARKLSTEVSASGVGPPNT